MKKTLTFTQERETKNTIRYQETSDVPAIGTLYVQKHLWAELGKPENLTIEINAK